MSSPAESRTLASAYESPTFGEDSSFHVEQPVGSMSISPCGRDVVLASKEGLHIIDLDSPYSPPRFLPHHTPWEVADVQWSPFAARDYWVVSTSNQKALVWNLAMKTWENSIEHVLHAHSRAITDINFSAHHPDVLATCSVDSFVHSWDLRIPTKPVISFSDWFAGATQVKWNRQDPHVIASSHDKYLRIWDDRMGAVPLKSIEAHSTKIYGIDWNRVRREAIVTCSLDKTVKLWNFEEDENEPERMIRTPFPVSRARNTPFGFGLLVMPQRGNNDLHLYSRRRTEAHGPGEGLPLVHSFPGHKGHVKEFLWRPRGTVVDGLDHREFQLVSWGADRELRLHRVDPEVLRGVGYEKGKSFDPALNLTRKGAVYKTFRDEPTDQEPGGLSKPNAASVSGARQHFSAGVGMNNVSMPFSRAWTQGIHSDSRVGMQGRSYIRADANPISWMRGVKISGWDIETLGDEITQVGEKFSKVVFESVDVRQRKATISLHGPWAEDGSSIFLKVDIRFPSDYPRNAIPVFRVQKTASMTNELAEKLTSELRTISETYLSQKRGCLEGAVRYLLGECNLEESIALVLGESVDAVKSPTNGVDEESSDEDEEVGAFQEQDLGMSSELLRPVNANVMVPVAKVCGATWTPDGKLLCFFPPKKDQAELLLDSLGFRDISRLSRSDRVFEGFGRLQTSSPGPPQPVSGSGTGALSTTDDGASEYSDESDIASSSSSESSDILSELPTRLQGPSVWRYGRSLGYFRSRSAENSQLSTLGGGGNDMSVKSSEAPHSFISIHDLSDLLPSKRSLASKYRIYGNGAEVCYHNAAVAADAGYHQLAYVWGLLRLILQSESDSKTLSSIDWDLLERRIFGSGHRKSNGTDTGHPLFRELHQSCGRKFSRLHDGAFARRWLVSALSDHFVQVGDVQMVAMLSCIFHEQNLRNTLTTMDFRGDLDSLNHSPFVPSLFFSNAIDSKSHAATPLTSLSKDSPNGLPPTHSPGVFIENWHSNPTTPYSTGTASPKGTRSFSAIPDRRTPNPSISASPDAHVMQRSGSGLGTALASSLSRSFTFGASSTPSPPTNPAKKKRQASPNGSLNIPTTTSGWSATGFISRAVSALPDYLVSNTVTSHTNSEAETDKKPETKSSMKVKVRFKNLASFDSDELSNNPFIDRERDCIYRAYRVAYANLLLLWGLPIQRSEVLGIEGPYLASHLQSDLKSRQPSLPMPTPKRRNDVPESSTSPDSLDVQRHCAKCGTPLQISVFESLPPKPSSSSGTLGKSQLSPICHKCKATQPLSAQVPCVICGEAVDGMLVPCLQCGHVSCFDCHQQWFASGRRSSIDSALGAADDDLGEDELVCPSGCGCRCPEQGIVIILPDEDDTRSKSSAAAGSTRFYRRRHSARLPAGHRTHRDDTMVGQSDDDLEALRGFTSTISGGLGAGLSRNSLGRDQRSY